jgi:hypothetical protein
LLHCVRTLAALCSDTCCTVFGHLLHCVRTLAALCSDTCCTVFGHSPVIYTRYASPVIYTRYASPVIYTRYASPVILLVPGGQKRPGRHFSIVKAYVS